MYFSVILSHLEISCFFRAPDFGDLVPRRISQELVHIPTRLILELLFQHENTRDLGIAKYTNSTVSECLWLISRVLAKFVLGLDQPIELPSSSRCMKNTKSGVLTLACIKLMFTCLSKSITYSFDLLSYSTFWMRYSLQTKQCLASAVSRE